MKHKQHPSGFTIVELLVVISIIALLVGILVPAVQKARDSAKTTQSKSNIHQVMFALQTYASDHNDRNFTTAPDNLSSSDRKGLDITAAINDLTAPSAYPMGIRLGQYGDEALIFFISYTGGYGAETGGIAPYCFEDGLTTSTTVGMGYGVWRYPNAMQVAEYMDGQTLHSAYFSPKDVVPLRAIEDCDDVSGSYCATAKMAAATGVESVVNSNMLAIPSSYCISPAMMYSPAVYQYNIQASPPQKPTDPMNLARGFKPPALDQARHPSQKTWLMEHNWLQNLSVNECSRMLTGTWFLDGVGAYDGCQPNLFNAHPDSEPIIVFADGTVGTYSINDFIIDSKIAKDDEQDQGIFGAEGLWISNLGPFGMGASHQGYYAENNEIVGVRWSGHTSTKFGIRGRDRIAK